MSSYVPMNLAGANLGQRHRCFNQLVTEAVERTPWPDLLSTPESSSVDRLLKIDVASKLQDAEYIISNLKDDDMLYVSRALKATWLLGPEYRDIINPEYLEKTLFPEMLKPATSKMIHWLYKNLRDPERCYEFYQHYKASKIGLALKFLPQCSDEHMIQEFPGILASLSPHHLQIFCEKCPKLGGIFFNALSTDKDIISMYQKKRRSYHNSIRCLLKSEPDLYLEILEKYHTANLRRLSPDLTKHIIRKHKNRFTSKPELYSAWLLHLPTLARQLSEEESRDLVVTLARAKFLSHWFCYENVEPLVKRLRPDRRAAFKQSVFVTKDIGVPVEEWPYQVPVAPNDPQSHSHVFDDHVDDPRIFKFSPYRKITKKKILRKRGNKDEHVEIISLYSKKTELDQLFDEYRFKGFEGTFHEISRRIGAASSVDSRRNMFLVLVSKTGGREECVSKLLGLMARHANEPANFRAALVRSLVNRAGVWRLSADAWTELLQFSYCLGLDGGPADAECREGLHAVVLRHLLAGAVLDPRLQDAYLEQFSDLSEYSLTAEERARVAAQLTDLLLAAAEDTEPEEAARYLDRLFGVFKAYRVPINSKSPVVLAAKALAQRQAHAARGILSQLYDARVARRELFAENLQFRHDDAACINVLRHDSRALDVARLVDSLVSQKQPLNRFASKLAVYFSESEGLAAQVLHAIQERILREPKAALARPLVTLIGRGLLSFIRQLHSEKEDVSKARAAVALKANAHHARPKLDMDAIERSELGARAAATRAAACRGTELRKYISELSANRRTVKTAFLLAARDRSEPAVLAAAAALRPAAVVKATLRYFRVHGDRADATIWDTIKPIILSLKLKDKPLQSALCCVDFIPKAVKADYCVTIFTALSKINVNDALIALHSDVEHLLPDMSVESMEHILLMMLSHNQDDIKSIVYPNFFVKYLLLCTSEEEQKRRLDTIGQQYLDRVIYLLNNLPVPAPLKNEYLNRTLECLRYNRSFFDPQYVSCKPVFKRVVLWLQQHYPMERYFRYYVEIHLTMLYHREVRRSIHAAPEVFSDPKRKMAEGVGIVGTAFGRMIAKEVNELSLNFFGSITDLYETMFKNYLNGYFLNCPSKHNFTEAILLGILQQNVPVAPRLVTYFCKETGFLVTDSLMNEIRGLLKKEYAQSLFFIHGELLH